MASLAAKKGRPQDLFMQFAAWPVTSGAASNTLVEAEYATGLTIRGGFGWLIHFVQFYMTKANLIAADQSIRYALSINQGEASLPAINDVGCISQQEVGYTVLTSGIGVFKQPIRESFLPPVIIANPKLSFYLQTSMDEAVLQAQVAKIRIGYTTVSLDNMSYLEIAETWEVI